MKKTLPEYLQKQVERLRDSERGALEGALYTLADNEGLVKDALVELGFSDRNLHEICAALRLIVDGEP